MAKRDEGGVDVEVEVDLDIVELLEEMGRAGLRPAMIVFLGDTGVPRIATRGVDPVQLLRDLARRSRAGRPCRRGVASWQQAGSDV